jgi:menaquinol-cytochrome c reductase iron-sulfur subunit
VAESDEQGARTPEEQGPERAPAVSIWPIGFAAGVAVLLVGVVLNWVVFGIGVGIAAVFGFFWAWDAMRVRRPAAEAVEAVEEAAEEEEEPERYGRNVFLERTTLGLGALIGAAVTVPVVGFAVAPTFIDQGDEDIDIGPLENFPEGQWEVTTFLSKEREGEVSRRTAFIRNNGLANGVPSFTIISNRCAHLGCPTQPGGPVEDPRDIETDSGTVTLRTAQPSGFVCPCHGGSYDTEGNRVAGPPVRALDRYTYKIVDGSVVLGERYSVGKVIGTGADARIESYTRFDPGQHVDGPTNWLYPASPQGI